jgi:FkbM family methyltransferase
MDYKSQIGQDYWVCNSLNNKRNGYFIDIGAHDGLWYSNTYYLEKELGWKGICVEPDKDMFNKLKLIRDCICINKAVYDQNTEVEFVSVEEINTPEGIRGIRTCLSKLYPKINGNSQFTETITMEKLMTDNNSPSNIDYISIDTEGAEYEILSGFPFNKYKVKLWTIEHNQFLDDSQLKKKIRRIMRINGYHVLPRSQKPKGANIFEDWYKR